MKRRSPLGYLRSRNKDTIILCNGRIIAGKNVMNKKLDIENEINFVSYAPLTIIFTKQYVEKHLGETIEIKKDVIPVKTVELPEEITDFKVELNYDDLYSFEEVYDNADPLIPDDNKLHE